MSKVRVLVGTKKGAFILTSDGRRELWEVSGPHFAGWEMYHLKGSPLNPDRIYASQTSSWFGQVIQRSDDGGRTWATPDGEPLPDPSDPPKGASNAFYYEGEAGTHKWYDGTQHPWEFKRAWHLEPSLTEPDTVWWVLSHTSFQNQADTSRESGRGLPQSKTLPRSATPLAKSARFWTAAVLCRFERRGVRKQSDDL